MSEETIKLSRRAFLSAAAVGVAMASVGVRSALADAPTTAPATSLANQTIVNHRYKIAAADIMLLKRQTLGAIQLAKDCGMDGVEVDMGGLGKNPQFKNQLRDDAFRQSYLDTCAAKGMQISSLAMSAFFGQSWANHVSADAFAEEWIETMAKMNIKVGFLPMGKDADLTDAPTRAKIVERLKAAAPKAEKAGVFLGIGGAIDVETTKRFLDEVASPAVKMYYHMGDQLEKGRDIYADIRALGKDRICQFHFSEEDGAWLGDGKIDLKKSKEAFDEIGFEGWLVVERSRVKGKSVKENFGANSARLKAVFQA